MPIKQITVQELKTKIDNNEEFTLLDVREEVEYNVARIANSVLIPLNNLPANLSLLDGKQEVVVLCHHGVRSMQAANFLLQVGFKNVSNVIGGIDAWSLHCDAKVARY
jgi:rhodanese-related sulfurtransferase